MSTPPPIDSGSPTPTPSKSSSEAGATAPLLAEVDHARLRPIVQFRVLYADTDKMGIAYHGAFFRYMEMARVELLRAVGLPYTEMEKLGLGLPLSDTAVRFRRPAHYDDLVTIHAGLVLASRVRVHFQYRFEVAAGDRADAHEAIEILIAETRHACVRREDARIERMPIAVHERLRAAMT